jgi:TolB-like protein/class 3 adenylate cyclase/Flp pilus assembly protein TadD
MNQPEFKRRLAAILSADVEGYSRLMREDEEATIRTLTAYRAAMTNLIEQYRGRVVDSPGDNLLAEFTSVVDAVNCAVEIQRELAERNAESPSKRKMEFRIGVNLGDVVEEGERIYGDGVNIASRMESLAEGGGICISGTVYDSIESKIGLEYEDLGEHEVKNIDKPVRVYRVLSYPGAAAHRVIRAKKTVRWKWRKKALATTAALALLIVAYVIWNYYFRMPSPQVEVASVRNMAFPLPNKPSIAVLPFTNLSGEAEQDYFTDGMTDDLITDLSKISGLFVIARNSVFTYKGKPVKIRQVAEELGVRYVLEGSVRRVQNQVRINAQLIDATTGGHLWAERYDGKMDDVFALQDMITRKIVTALKVQLTGDEEKQVTRKETDQAEAYDAFLKGWAFYRRESPDDLARAIPHFEEAVRLDSDYSRGYAALAAVYWRGRLAYKSLGISHEQAIAKAKQYLQKAMKDPTPLAHYVASLIYRSELRYQEAITQATRAISLDANDPAGYLAMARVLIRAGSPKEAVDFTTNAMRLDPNYPHSYLYYLGQAQFGMEQYDEAAASFGEASKQNPNNWRPFLWLAMTYGHLGREQAAKSALDTFKRLFAKAFSNIPITMQALDMYVMQFKEEKDRERLREGFIRAGVPPEQKEIAGVKDLISQTEGGFEVEGATLVDVKTAKALFDRGVRFIDVRSKNLWNFDHIPGAVNLEAINTLSEAGLSKILSKDQEVVFYCAGPG